MSSGSEAFITPPEGLERLLLAHLPTSLTLLRKVQYLRRKATSTAKFPQILLASDGAPIGDGAEPLSQPSSFTVAYINTTVAQSTSMYLYSTLQNYQDEPPSSAVAETERQLELILQKLIQLRQAMEEVLKIELPPSVVLGSLHSRIRGLWEKTGRISPRPTGLYDKWIFDVSKVPRLDESLPEGMAWGSGTLEDCQVVASRTDIPRPVYVVSQNRYPPAHVRLLITCTSFAESILYRCLVSLSSLGTGRQFLGLS